MDADADAYADRYARFSGGVGGAFRLGRRGVEYGWDGGVRQRTGGVAVGGIAQEQGLLFVPPPITNLRAARGQRSSPGTPSGEALPMLFGEPNDRACAARLAARVVDVRGRRRLPDAIGRGDLRRGPFRFPGRLHVLLVERRRSIPLERNRALSTPAGRRVRCLWRSREDPLWSIEAAGSQLQVRSPPRACCPISDHCAAGATGDLRKRLRAGCVCGAPPFARQWAATLWRFVSIEEALELSGVVRPGYNLEDEVLVSTPLTALAHVLAALQTTDVGAASNYVAASTCYSRFMTWACTSRGYGSASTLTKTARGVRP